MVKIRFVNQATKRILRPSKKWRVFNDAVFDIYLADIKVGYVELADDPTGWEWKTLGISKIEISPEYRQTGLATAALQQLLDLTNASYVYAEITNTLSYGLFCKVFGYPIDVDAHADIRRLSKTPGFMGKKYTIDMIFKA